MLNLFFTDFSEDVPFTPSSIPPMYYFFLNSLWRNKYNSKDPEDVVPTGDLRLMEFYHGITINKVKRSNYTFKKKIPSSHSKIRIGSVSVKWFTRWNILFCFWNRGITRNVTVTLMNKRTFMKSSSIFNSIQNDKTFTFF